MKRKILVLVIVVSISVMIWRGMMNKVDRFDSLFQYYGNEYSIDWKLIKAVAICESNLNQFAVSPSSAKGLMQLMDNTARMHGVISIFDIEDNVHGGVKEIERLTKLFYGERSKKERFKFVLASYNGGLGYVEEAMRVAVLKGDSSLKWSSVAGHLRSVEYRGRRPDVAQIVGYVEKVMRKYEELKNEKV